VAARAMDRVRLREVLKGDPWSADDWRSLAPPPAEPYSPRVPRGRTQRVSIPLASVIRSKSPS